MLIPHEKNNLILEQIFEKYRYLMHHIAYEILHDSALAEDIVTSVFLHLSEADFVIDDILSKKTRAYIVIVTRNAAINLYQKRKREAINVVYLDEEMDEIPDQGLLPSETVLNRADIEDVISTLKKIDEKYSDVMILKYFYNLTDKEIAKTLGISVELVRMRLSRARKILTGRLVEKGNG